MTKTANQFRRWAGSKTLFFDAVEETTNLIERSHVSSANRAMRPFVITGPLAKPAQSIHALHAATATTVYEAVRKTSRGVETLLDAGTDALHDTDGFARVADQRLEEVAPLRSDAAGSRPWALDHIEAHINGFWGDYLANRQNPLDLGMTLRVDGQAVSLEREILASAYPETTGKLAIFVHGLCCTEWAWSISADEYYGDPGITIGRLLQDELGYTPLYVRYNSGRHISENGRALSDLMAQVVDNYPHAIDDIVLIGHSMGGLVARSATHYASTTGDGWVDKLSAVFNIGAPNLGAPLEQAVGIVGGLLSAIDLVGTQVPAQMLNTRSAGIKDLRHGYTVDEEWCSHPPNDPLTNGRRKHPLVDGVGYYFIAATATEDPNHPVARLIGDLLVRLPSAKGEATTAGRNVEFHAGRVFNGINHFHLANHPEVYAVIKEFLVNDTARG